MRTLLLAFVAVTAALTACASDPAPSCGDLGRSVSCACPGGSLGSQECGPLGVWSACVCPSSDAGGDDAATDAAADAATDVARDTPMADVIAVADAGADVADVPTCDANLSNDPANCGACGHVCAGVGGCYRGRCQTGQCPSAAPGANECSMSSDCSACVRSDTPTTSLPCCVRAASGMLQCVLRAERVGCIP